jgi:hypothetical protein
VIYLYLIALVVGGGLLGVSLVLGGHDAGHEVPPTDALAPAGHEGPLGGAEGPLYWLVSVRFWTFFVAFFGLTGLVFDGLGLASQTVTVIVAACTGATAGGAAMFVIRRITREEANSAVTSKDYVGRTGRVLVGFGAGGVG